jgi:hypothetical protein
MWPSVATAIATCFEKCVIAVMVPRDHSLKWAWGMTCSSISPKPLREREGDSQVEEIETLGLWTKLRLRSPTSLHSDSNIWRHKCHGSKGPWLEVSIYVTCSAQVLSVSTRRREDSQDERSERSWIEGKVETEVSTLHSYRLNTTTPRGFTPLPSYNNWPVMTSHDVISYSPVRT